MGITPVSRVSRVSVAIIGINKPLTNWDEPDVGNIMINQVGPPHDSKHDL